MKTKNQLLVLLFAAITVSMIACRSGNQIGGSSKSCGCGVNKGMVGYR
jgi:hypothetical protein